METPFNIFFRAGLRRSCLRIEGPCMPHFLSLRTDDEYGLPRGVSVDDRVVSEYIYYISGRNIPVDNADIYALPCLD